MLIHWCELFQQPPGSPRALQSLSREDVQDCLAKHPSSWTRLLHEICTAEDDDNFADSFIWTLFSSLEDAVREADEKVWRRVWRTGFLSTLAQLVDGMFLCGFTRDELISDERGMRLERVSEMLSLLMACLDRVIQDDRPEEVKHVLGIMQDTGVGVYMKIWDVKDPFLISELRGTEHGASGTSLNTHGLGVSCLFRTLVRLGHLTATQLYRHQMILFIDSCIPHVFLLIWIWSPDLPVRNDAIEYLGLVSQMDSGNGHDTWAKFFSVAAQGCCGNGDILEAIFRDLIDEEIVDDTLANVLILLSMWQYYSQKSEETLGDDVFELAPVCLAAARRQLCCGSVTQAGEFGFDAVISATFKTVTHGPRLRGRQCYAYLDLLAHDILLRIDEDEESIPVIYTQCLDYVLDPLRVQASSTRPRSVAERSHTLHACQAVVDAFVHYRVAQRSAVWRRFMQDWGTVRALLAPPSGSEPPLMAFGVLERCAWAECLCSRHKPAHRMRVCNGCESVAYCGKGCQTKDWNNGGHRELCRRRNT
ncbi:zinc finger MYND domain-containing protein [Phanerochaete sordida]|uniref:Zinc finger MYND domain-containing protein n=1 Tax=Phanerochaete sordida TaxID=48140 RepID=A0A9P3GEB7_9APHY|nr:zinc finger MYND domain-containing protein [Phanerochaete sordida]